MIFEKTLLISFDETGIHYIPPPAVPYYDHLTCHLILDEKI